MKTKPCQVCGVPLKQSPTGGLRKYCNKCRDGVLREQHRLATRRHWDKVRGQNKCNKCNKPLPRYKHLCEKCKKPTLSRKQLVDKIATLEKEITLYEQMFASQQQQLEQLLDRNKELKREVVIWKRYMEDRKIS